jgi:hypothetical protein
MRLGNTSLRTYFLLLVAGALILLNACGSGSNPSDGSTTDTGVLHFSLVYHSSGDHIHALEAAIDCQGEGIATIEAMVYNSVGNLLASGGPWNCDAGRGTISSVPAGGGRIIVILGKNNENNVVFRGHKSGIQINANQENDVGIIACYSFTPNLQAPAHGAVLNTNAMGFSWSDVAGATEYRLVVSSNSELSDSIINTVTIARNYKPSGLSDSTTYFWQVVAGDAYGNRGIGSQIRSFSINAQHTNSAPGAKITSPANDSTFTTADDIVFTGNGSDAQDGDLSGTSLVWHSDKDGTIGQGVSTSSNTLSAGIHQITLTATDSEGATGTDSVLILVANGKLPDTGQTLSYTQTFGEDSDYLIHLPNYTKLDADGGDLDASAAEWAMVRDNITGLIWEVKTDDGGSRDKDTTLTWGQVWDFSYFYSQLNFENFGGYSDWRCPTNAELATLVHKDKFAPAIDEAFFPNTMSGQYWSNDSAYIKVNDMHVSWTVDFETGWTSFEDNNDYFDDSSTNRFYVRAVRGEKKNFDLVDNGDGTVTDMSTGLMWQQDEAGAMTWEGALTYCETLALGGHSDWRLPNYNELLSIVDTKEELPMIDHDFFPGTLTTANWTSTTVAEFTTSAWRVDFYYGQIGQSDKSSEIPVRAVRGGR